MNANTQAGDEHVELAVEVFTMLADVTRVKILLALREGEQSVGDLAAAVRKPTPGVSQHLAKLRLARMVVARHEGTRVFYRLADDHASELVSVAMHQAEHMLGTAPEHIRVTQESSTDRA
ncbi:metalloregulator ArsR/SmtB family transcription factor [Agrococcus sp. ARC_14]|uniref:ArsR/SmtB family transcription factor n=1 Tax=Agrococcus sp. ARC_14 TaxID=2919927 RepID=UPI001F06CFE0|nr:metalloregulator ArsR/SmtB family transcription factor [Agrococcus sp. ARC_14]MCH1883999.1 metalloregulator ArsR/SmtB family transcription factor [Agrococcus sp. ARC_14]